METLDGAVISTDLGSSSKHSNEIIVSSFHHFGGVNAITNSNEALKIVVGKVSL